MPQKPLIYRPTAKKAAPPSGPRASAAKRGYGHGWRKARLSFLADNPFCVECKKLDLIVEATEVDHVIPHKGNPILFWDVANLESLCKSCHSRKTARENPGNRRSSNGAS